MWLKWHPNIMDYKNLHIEYDSVEERIMGTVISHNS